MNIILFISLIFFIQADNKSVYEEMDSTEIAQEDCEDIIDQISTIIEEGYIFSDFLKAPVQPEGQENYIQKVDLIKELKDINTTNRTFYSFYRDIVNIITKTRDGHFYILNAKFIPYTFCLPFKYKVFEHDENGKENNASLTIESIDDCEEFEEKIYEKILHFSGKKIIKINGVNPYVYLDELGSKVIATCHSPQCRYIKMINSGSIFDFASLPLSENETKVEIEFEGGEKLETSYQLSKLDTDFKEFLLAEIKKK